MEKHEGRKYNAIQFYQYFTTFKLASSLLSLMPLLSLLMTQGAVTGIKQEVDSYVITWDRQGGREHCQKDRSVRQEGICTVYKET